jgi:hypothetical protein
MCPIQILKRQYRADPSMDILNLLAKKAQPLASTVSADGQLLNLSASLSDQLGYALEELLAQPIERIFSVESVRAVAVRQPACRRTHPEPGAHLDSPQWRPAARDRQWPAGMADRATGAPAPGENPLGSLGHRLREMHNANEVMSQMLQSAKVAYWCIEFAEAVNINNTPDEIVRQVFENDSHWRLCNRAMADVYEMPSDVDFNQQPVRLYWPRSPANEAFVRRLIEAGFSVDCASRWTVATMARRPTSKTMCGQPSSTGNCCGCGAAFATSARIAHAARRRAAHQSVAPGVRCRARRRVGDR